jgi:hypothetical protein
MPATRSGQGNGGENTNPGPAPGSGAWQQSSSGTWTWNSTGTPDPTLVSQWGYTAITNIEESPTGTPNTGSWVPQHGGGWDWLWGDNNPDQNLINTYGRAQLTNPDYMPGDGNNPTDGANQPVPDDVNTPNLNDIWNGNPPIVTGDPTGSPPSGQTVSTPPVHSPYVVAPGDIRNAESVVLNTVDGVVTDYDSLQSQVSAAKSDNVYMTGTDSLINGQDRLLLNVGDALELAGQFVSALNNAAQYYAKADIDSYLPQS